MFSQISSFFSDLKQGWKSSGGRNNKTSYKTNKKKSINYDEDEIHPYGCLGRSVSMEWSQGSAARKKRTTSMQSLDRMSEKFRSAVSLMELSQSSGAAPQSAQNIGVSNGTRGATAASYRSSRSNNSGRNGNSATQENRLPSFTSTCSESIPRQHNLPQQYSSMNQLSNSHSSGKRPRMPQRTSSFQVSRPSDSAPDRPTHPPPDRPGNRSSKELNNLVQPQSRRIPKSDRNAPNKPPRRGRTKDQANGFDQPDGQSNAFYNRNVLPLTTAQIVNTGSQLTPNGKANGYLKQNGNNAELENIYGLQETTDRALQLIADDKLGVTYGKGKLLGKGGFAKCYEMTEVRSQKTYAGKIIPKCRLTKGNQMEKILREVELHRNLVHRNVVSFHSFFEDESTVYIILENCSRKSLVHVLKRRKTLTEPEVRYYMLHLVNGVRYIHSQRVIHRDLKLGNMLLNENMDLKIADFGLATRVEYDGEKKMTVCGTPNYIAPEVLQKFGHSYEADIWALGCVMYALLCGRPPFETSTLKETYMRIVTNRFVVPPHVSMSARNLICLLLKLDPDMRPSLDQIANDEYFSDGHLPDFLSPSTCETPPKFPVSNINLSNRRARLNSILSSAPNTSVPSSFAQTKGTKKSASQIITRVKPPDFVDSVGSMLRDAYLAGSAPSIPRDDLSIDLNSLPLGSSARLYQRFASCLDGASKKENAGPSAIGDTNQSNKSSRRTMCVTKWVDYSNKYGFGFQLSNNSVGILFNDNTRMMLAEDSTTIQVETEANQKYSFTTRSIPSEFQKKATLLLYFTQFMETHLIPGGQLQQTTTDRSAVVFLKRWFRTEKAVILYLTDGTLQVNFFEDHTKVILNPEGQDYQLTLVSSSRHASTYPLRTLRHSGCTPEVLERLRYACLMLNRIVNIEGETELVSSAH